MKGDEPPALDFTCNSPQFPWNNVNALSMGGSA